MTISIFAKRAFLSTNPSEDFEFKGKKPKEGYLKRVSSIIRADQIAEEVGAKLNPIKGYKKDVCVYVKPEIKADEEFKFEGKSNYLDVIDEWGYIETLKKYPEVNAIALSERDYTNLSEVVSNKVVFIPQHHCNFNRDERTRKSITTVGIIGNEKAFSYLPKELSVALEERGLKLHTFSDFFTRQDIVSFYKKIDLQIVWRPYRKKLANPLKIVNAASFGIPTVALEEIYFKEMGNSYIGVTDFRLLLHEIDRLLDSPSMYEAYSKLCLEHAEKYHIDKIAGLYKDLI